ncbi:solute carrier family 52, riboflavin transporter, member 3-B-like [Leptopilina heterotoma]|uniref:solute carrier family 52, riboflavin transporter, member 3-B-like n=1 Tax=Leptopilina heterotoma TaxID=63436 RepID=UPI001CA8CA7A|nr:solute carrier family 52, riboflavin transporter, member 3-B-like [Leptopilina heterotoma]
MVNIQLQERFFTNSLIVHILITTFGISAWLGINAIFVELPILVNTTKEWNLPMYIVIMVQVANIGPLSYILARKFGFKFHESRWIFSMLMFGAIIMLLLAFFYEKTLTYNNKEYNFVLLLVTFLTALINCSSSLLFMPYLRYFREIYLVSYFIGEGLSGILPSIIALIQGSGSSDCDNSSASSARFTSKYYFIATFLLLVLSLVAFFLLEKLSLVKNERILEEEIKNEDCRRKSWSKSCEPGEDGENSTNSEGKKELESNEQNHIESLSSERETDNRTKLQLSFKIYLYFLLGVMCLLGNGFLPGIQSYSSLPYGNQTYHLTATLSQLANPTACFLVMLFSTTSSSSSRVINSLSAIVFVICGYVMYLAFESPEPPLQHSVIGKVLVISSWILLIGLISYVKLAITTIFRHESQSENLFRIGIVMQFGSACGALVSFLLITFTRLLNSYDSCADKV